jgi:ParB-like chromosome segregation protein Spo0J
VHTTTSRVAEGERRARPRREDGQDAHRRGPLIDLNVADVHVGRTPRAQLDQGHVELLLARLNELPPILVHAPTLALVDGAHRLAAFRLAGRQLIPAVLFEGSEGEAFIEAVRSNVTHGKPLTLRERQSAAVDLLRLDPNASDRRVGEICGLAPDSIGRLRRAVGANGTHRVGRDGRRRPLDPTEGRRHAGDLLTSDPGLSDRRVATAAGISQGTVRDVRRRIVRGEDPVPERLRQRAEHADPSTSGSRVSLIEDNAVRSSSDARALARWMETHRVCDRDWQRWLATIPLGRMYVFADEARQQAEIWSAFADALEERARRSG